MARSPKQGLAEYVLVMALLVMAGVGAVAYLRHPIRAFFGAPAARASADARPAPGPPSRR